LREAARALTLGGVIVFPTETFYGLGVAALDSAAVDRLLALKGRPAGKPVLVLVDSVAMAESVAEVSPAARALMARHWPGALTLVMPARAHVPHGITAGTGTVGVRMSPHAVACGIVTALGAPVTAPSANPAGAHPPTIAADVLGHFESGIDLVIDGGPTPGGPPSTVLDVTVDPPRVLRAGAVRV
jgi:L-threonylcarbamoyladenylate synthase